MTETVFEPLPNGEYAYLRPERNRSMTVVPEFSMAVPSIEARALAMLSRYLAREPERTEAEEIIARDAFMSAYRAGFRAGRKETFEACSNLAAASDQFERAANKIEQLIRDVA